MPLHVELLQYPTLPHKLATLANFIILLLVFMDENVLSYRWMYTLFCTRTMKWSILIAIFLGIIQLRYLKISIIYCQPLDLHIMTSYYCSIPGKHPCTTSQGATVVASISLCGPKLQVMFKRPWAFTRDTIKLIIALFNERPLWYKRIVSTVDLGLLE